MNRSSENIDAKPPGTPPGTLYYVGLAKQHQVEIRVIDYNESKLKEETISDLSVLDSYRGAGTTSWINIDGVHDMNQIKEIGQRFDLHALLLEDVMNTTHRPKVEDHGDSIYLTFKMLTFDETNLSLGSEQVSLVMGRHYVLSFQETPADILNPVRRRLGVEKSRIRTRKSDYLVYALVDTVVDSYFSFVESFDKHITELEDRVYDNPMDEDIKTIQRMKKQLLTLRRSITPLRESLSFLQNADSDLIESRTIKYFNDVHDHLLQVLDIIELNRGLLDNLMDAFATSMSNRMNQVMKILTIIATIFIPMTFIAGIYGMNFEYMPELGWQYAYPVFWGVMAVLFGGMLIFFKRSRWL